MENPSNLHNSLHNLMKHVFEVYGVSNWEQLDDDWTNANPQIMKTWKNIQPRIKY